MTPYVKKVVDLAGIKDAGLIDLYTPGINGHESAGKSVDTAAKWVRDGVDSQGGEAVARARLESHWAKNKCP